MLGGLVKACVQRKNCSVPEKSEFPNNFCCILLMAHLGFLHFSKAFLRCSNSSLRSSGVVHTVLALWIRVPMKLSLADRLWLLSLGKYWSVWVGLWLTVIEREWSACGVTKVSRKGIAPLSLLPLTVNCIAGSILLI